jgi:hypothetical protein
VPLGRRDAVVRPGGRWAALETCRIEPRQNGKTGGELLPVVLFDLFLMPPDKIVWTAHLFRTARDAFNDFDRMIANDAGAVEAGQEGQLRQRRRGRRAQLRRPPGVPGPVEGRRPGYRRQARRDG